MGSTPILAAKSSMAEQVRKLACWLLGARHACEGPALTETDVWLRRVLGMLVETYGRGGCPPPANPPLAQVSDCQAVMVPSFMPAILILPWALGRLPAICCSAERCRALPGGLVRLRIGPRFYRVGSPAKSRTNQPLGIFSGCIFTSI